MVIYSTPGYITAQEQGHSMRFNKVTGVLKVTPAEGKLFMPEHVSLLLVNAISSRVR